MGQEEQGVSSPSDLEDLTAEASLSLADGYHIDENYSEAIDHYAAAISLIRESESIIHFRALSHRSEAFLKLARHEEALEDAKAGLELLSKGLSGLRSGESEVCHKRAGMAAYYLNEYDTAKDFFEKALQLAGLNYRPDTVYKKWIQICEERLNPAPVAPPVTSAEKSSSSPLSASLKQDTTRAEQESTRATSTANQRPQMPKYQYYQNDNVMTIFILESNVKEQDLKVTFEPKWLNVILTKTGVDFTVIAGALYGEINVEKSKVVIKDEKVLIKLRKVDAHEWHELFGKADDSKRPKLAKKSTATAEEVPKEKEIPRPYASNRDWDAIEKTVIAEEKNEKPEGDEAMNKLFQQIYANASEETRRAMIKSYQTSGGTVLSTNWDEVSKTDYEKERTAPKGMEWKSWEGDKLPMKDDD